MVFRPDYGETLLSDEDRDALTGTARELLGDRPRKADLYDLEQLIQNEVANEYVTRVVRGDVVAPDLLADHVVRELHGRLYAPVWRWGGRLRSRQTNIGIPYEHIAVEMRNALDNLLWLWAHQKVTPRWLGIAAHAELVHIHPFVDGNGRVTRLFADLVFLAAQEDDGPVLAYDWEIDRQTYIRMLGEYDVTRDPARLVDLVDTFDVGE